MPHLPASNKEGPCFPTSNNEDIQKMAATQLLSYYGVTKASNVSDPLILGSSTIGARSRESERMTRKKDNPTTTVNAATKKQNDSDPFIPVALMESVRSCRSEYANTKNDDNRQDRIPIDICAIGCRHLPKNRKTVTKSGSDKSKRDKMSNATDKNTKEKELGISNSSIKVHNSHSSVLLNLSA